jgi:hypothetical protein
MDTLRFQNNRARKVGGAIYSFRELLDFKAPEVFEGNIPHETTFYQESLSIKLSFYELLPNKQLPKNLDVFKLVENTTMTRKINLDDLSLKQKTGDGLKYFTVFEILTKDGEVATYINNEYFLIPQFHNYLGQY